MSDKRWEAITAVPLGDLVAAVKVLGDMIKAGATREEVKAAKEAMVRSWMDRKEGHAGN